MTQRSDFRAPVASPCRWFVAEPCGVHLADDARVRRWTDAPGAANSVRSSGELVPAATRATAVVQPARRRRRARRDPARPRPRHRATHRTSATAWCEPSELGAVATTLLVVRAGRSPPSQPAARARSSPASGSCCTSPRDWPEGSLPLSVMLLTYTVAAWSSSRRAVVGLGVVYAHAHPARHHRHARARRVRRRSATWRSSRSPGRSGSPCGPAARRSRAGSARPRSAPTSSARAPARVLAEERLRIAQELHDVVAHSMSVIAVQAGVGAHVLADRPDQARAALDAISATSRGTLTEMRRLLGVLRDSDGERAHAPAPGLADVPQPRRRRPQRGRARDAQRRGLERVRQRRRRAVRLPGRAGGAHQRDEARRHGDPRRRQRASTCRARWPSRSSTTDAAPPRCHPSTAVTSTTVPSSPDTGWSACASGSSCGAASSSVGPSPAAATASRRCCRTVTPNDYYCVPRPRRPFLAAPRLAPRRSHR